MDNVKYKFKPFDKVLVRMSDYDNWECCLFSHYDSEHPAHYCCSGSYWMQCVPFDGNESLIGTNKQEQDYYEQNV